jgi:integrase
MGRPSKGGIHRVPKKLADGTTVLYLYAWQGGPKLPGPEGSPEFRRALAEALAIKAAGPIANSNEPRATAGKTLEWLIDLYLDSPEFRKRKERTQRDYRKLLAAVPTEHRQMPIIALGVKNRARGIFLRWRDQLAKKSDRQADYAWVVLNIVLNFATTRGEIEFNPCARSGVEKLYSTSRKHKVWTEGQMAAFRAAASPELSLAMALAFWTLQRQGDLLRLPWTAYDGDVIALTQGKTDVDIVVPVAAPLRAILDATPRKDELMLVNQSGEPWTPDGFRVMWRKTCIKAGVPSSRKGGVTFHDLRGTAASRMGRAGCTTIEIASITGHGLESGTKRSSLAGYVNLDLSVARAAMAKFEVYEAGENRILNRAQPIDLFRAKNRGLKNLSQ